MHNNKIKTLRYRFFTQNAKVRYERCRDKILSYKKNYIEEKFAIYEMYDL